MATEWIAATTGLDEFSQARMTDSRFGSAVALGEPNSLMSAPPENALPAPVMTMALTAGSAFAWSRPCGDRGARGVAQPVDRRVVHRDHGDVAVHLVFSRHGRFLWDEKRTVVLFCGL
jgi:hypothetical protein